MGNYNSRNDIYNNTNSVNQCGVSNDTYTENELLIYEKNRKTMFKATIAVCAIYAVIAILLILFGYFTEMGKNLIFGSLLPFVVVYILGSIFIIIYFSNKIYSYKPQKIDYRINYDNNTCPDYWDMVYNTSNASSSNFSKKINSSLFNYYCKMNNSFYNKRYLIPDTGDEIGLTNIGTDINSYTSINNKIQNDGNSNNLHYYRDLNKSNISSLSSSDYLKFKEYALYMNKYDILDGSIISNIYRPESNLSESTGRLYSSVDGATVTITDISNALNNKNTKLPLLCDVVYPNYLGEMDKQNASANLTDRTNKYRCAYAETCKIPWSDLNCD